MSERPPDLDDVPEQMRVRLEKRARLLDSGVPPYPVTVERTHTLAQVPNENWYLPR